MWYTPIAVGTVVIIGIVISYLSHPLKPHELDSKLIIRLDDLCRYCCCSKQQRRSTNSVVSGEVSTKQQRSKDTDIELTTSLTTQ
ncbi:unnamed protein product [Adineta steineri]|uniref:Uncharacterized protein n=1 Tax=Adineta steineri TaxID=433720 RepID=A0A819SX67_9BILA|nr:unnamed protein product [Adineta steineri]